MTMEIVIPEENESVRIGRKLWEQLPNESDKAYNAFLVYRDIGRTRSLPAAYRKHSGKDAKQANGQWNLWSDRFNWRERARAWDIEQDQIKTDAYSETVKRMFDRQIKVSLAFQQKVVERLESMQATDLDPKDMVRWFKAAVEIERIARGVKDGKMPDDGQIAAGNDENDKPNSPSYGGASYEALGAAERAYYEQAFGERFALGSQERDTGDTGWEATV